MKIRDLLSKDPQKNEIVNNGVASVTDGRTPGELRTLRYELESFVCDGQYAKGLSHVLSTYLKNLEKAEQPAVWVSGFFGSGKSHFVKMLRYLWVDYEFPDGARARGLARLPHDVSDLLKELSADGKRHGGLQAASGTLGAGTGDSLRLAFLEIAFRSLGLPGEYPMARFILWLKSRGIEEKVRRHVEKAKMDFDKEIKRMYVSPSIAEALLAADKDFARNVPDARSTLKTQFPNTLDPSTDNMVDALQEAFSVGSKFPCTLIVLDEVQQYIGENSQRANMVQEVTEGCVKKFGSKLLFVATGQSALSGTPQLAKLRDRFKVPVQLSDADVETVVRTIVLSKKQDKVPAIKEIISTYSGEITRQLNGTKIETRTEDRECYVADYPLLPVRRRFWERVLRAVDRAGTTAQLRSQLKVVHEAVRAIADAPAHNVVAGDFIFDQISTTLVQTGVMQKEIDELIRQQDNGTAEGRLRKRLLSLIFLINRLPRDPGVDQGIRATPEVLADLLVENLKEGSSQVRKQIPELLKGLLHSGQVMQVDSEFRLQTRESAAWDQDYRDRLTKLLNNDARIATARGDTLREECLDRLKEVKLLHGKSKVPRKLETYFNTDPQPPGQNIPVWIRDGWNEDEKTAISDARGASVEDPTLHIFIPKRSPEELKKELASLKSAEETLQVRGVPTTLEGQEARLAMETRLADAKAKVTGLTAELFSGTRVFLAGGSELDGLAFKAKVEDAAESALSRLYPQFSDGDDPRWEKVIERAKKGDATALDSVDHKGDVEKNSVCSTVLGFIGTSKKGNEIRKHFGGTPYGWPQDTVDGALLALVVSGHLRASQSGQPVEAKYLDRQKISVVDFRSENITITAAQRLAVRKLLQDVGIPCKPGEEANAIPILLAELLRRAGQAGGDAPSPSTPNKSHLADLSSLSGNDQFVAVFNQRVQLDKEAKEWKETAEAIQRRLPRWQTLNKLLGFAGSLPLFGEITSETEAIASQRSLLDSPDPVPPLCERLAQALREALAQQHKNCGKVFDEQTQLFDKSDIWAKLNATQKKEILEAHDVGPIPPIKVGTEAEILQALENRSLKEWQNLCDALPQRFAKALNAAIKLLQPKAVAVTLRKATLTTEPEVDGWLAEAKQEILKHLKDGPVIV